MPTLMNRNLFNMAGNALYLISYLLGSECDPRSGPRSFPSARNIRIEAGRPGRPHSHVLLPDLVRTASFHRDAP